MIWVVDDDPELRKMVGTYLIDQGYDVRGNPGQLRARRLSRRYQLADTNADNRLSKGEAAAMPWVARHFEFLDRNRDGLVSWRELLDLQRSLTPDQRRP